MLKTVYIVPDCPRCGSKVTGRFIHTNKISRVEQIKALERGELIRPLVLYDPYNISNAFCECCGHEWNADIETKKLSEDEIAAIAKEKCITEEAFHKVYGIHNPSSDMKERKKAAKLRAKNKAKNTRKTLFNIARQLFFSGTENVIKDIMPKGTVSSYIPKEKSPYQLEKEAEKREKISRIKQQETKIQLAYDDEYVRHIADGSVQTSKSAIHHSSAKRSVKKPKRNWKKYEYYETGDI